MPFTPIILAHLVTAIAALFIGAFVLATKKGGTTHKLLGKIWVVLMLSTALFSFGIRSHGHFSPIHILSVITVLGITAAILAARHGRINAHRRGMTITYAGLLIAGAFAMMPGRRFGDLVLGALGVV